MTRAYKAARTALACLMQATMLSSVLLPAVTAPALAQDDTSPLVVDLAKDTPERVAGARPDPKSLEGGIWAETAKVEQAAKTSGERNTDPDLTAYVTGVEAKISGPFAGDMRVYVMDRPFFNAATMVNGYTEVWSGLLLRCQTEDELAFVLGHEAGHFRHTHVLKTYQQIKNGQNAALAATLVIGVLAMGASANASSYQQLHDISNITQGLIDITYLGTIAALMSYSRETEAEADAYGLIYMHDAGYYTGAAPQLWQERLDETAASDYDKVRRSPSRINIFGDHPLEVARILALNARAKAMNGGQPPSRGEEDARAARAAYRAHVRPFLASWLKDDLRRQDYGQTVFIIDRLLVDNSDAGVLNFYKGEAYRLRGRGGDLESALAAYQTALAAPDAPRETNRQIGDIYRRLGDNASALKAFQAYLAMAPDADDAWIVQDEVDTLAKSMPAAGPAPAPTSQDSGGTT